MKVYKRTNSKFYYYDFIKDGKRYRGSTGCEIKADAIKSTKNILNDPQEHLLETRRASRLNDKVLTLCTLEVKLKDDLKTIYVAHKSYTSFYVPVVNKISASNIGQKNINEITDNDLKLFINECIDQYARSTINQYLTVIHACMKRHAKVAFNNIEWSTLKLSKANKMHTKTYTKTDLEAVYAFLREKQWYTSLNLIRVLVGSGIRLSGILNLKTEQIDFKAGCIRLTETKNDVVSVHPMTQDAMEALKEQGNELFSMLTKGTLTNHWCAVQKHMNWPKSEGYKLHALRHTFATELAKKGVDIRTIQALLGHKQISQTVRYTHVANESLINAVKVLDA